MVEGKPERADMHADKASSGAVKIRRSRISDAKSATPKYQLG